MDDLARTANVLIVRTFAPIAILNNIWRGAFPFKDLIVIFWGANVLKVGLNLKIDSKMQFLFLEKSETLGIEESHDMSF